jgi:hypothetical protein
MDGHGGEKLWPSRCRDPIIGLLDHSDCDGSLSQLECEAIAPRLRELVMNWPIDDYDRRQALRLADGMDVAVRVGEDFLFR